ncbi:MAG: hypothetical protein HZA36_01285 [Parcubacteria group bacterium]|nr:hypothetical protein [Parcubacteria group bacterium]
MRTIWELDEEYFTHHKTITPDDRLHYFRRRYEAAKQCVHEGHTSDCLEESDIDKKCYLSKEKEQHLKKCFFCQRYFGRILTELRGRQFRWQLRSALQGLFIYFIFGVYAPYLERKQEKKDRHAAKRLGITVEEYRSRKYAEMGRKRRREILEARERLKREAVGEGTVTEECNLIELNWYPHVTEWRLAHVRGCNYYKQHIIALPPYIVD